MKGVERGTREYFETIKQQISIEQVADYLMQRQGKNYIYPGEKSASVRLYQNTQSFYDFGRACGGDEIRLWSHVRGVDSWTALKQIRECFGLNTPDKQHSRDLIRKQEEARRRQQEAKKQKQERWIRQVDKLKAEAELLSGILSSGHCKPLSWLWCVCQNRLTTVNIQLDLLCKQGFAEMEANKQKKADQEPVELVNADGVHVTAQSNGTNSAAAYFAKNYSNCMNQKTTEPED